MLRGADVTLVTGKTALTPPPFITTVPVISAKDMYEEVTARSAGMDMIFKAAAVADYRPVHIADEKIQKNRILLLSIDFENAQMILLKISRRTQNSRSIPLRLLYGNGKYAGEFQKEAG